MHTHKKNVEFFILHLIFWKNTNKKIEGEENIIMHIYIYMYMYVQGF
jgi:hypothetical protein